MSLKANTVCAYSDTFWERWICQKCSCKPTFTVTGVTVSEYICSNFQYLLLHMGSFERKIYVLNHLLAKSLLAQQSLMRFTEIAPAAGDRSQTEYQKHMFSQLNHEISYIQRTFLVNGGLDGPILQSVCPLFQRCASKALTFPIPCMKREERLRGEGRREVGLSHAT